MEGLCCLFPVLAIELAHGNGGKIHLVDAANVRRPLAWIEPGPNEGVDAAMPAEVVLRRLGVELIERELLLAREDAKILLGGAVPQRAPAATHRAVALDDVVELRP